MTQPIKRLKSSFLDAASPSKHQHLRRDGAGSRINPGQHAPSVSVSVSASYSPPLTDFTRRSHEGAELAMYVGHGAFQRLYVVRQSLLAHYSAYYKLHQNEREREARLPDEKPEPFFAMLAYLHDRKLFIDEPILMLNFHQLVDVYDIGLRWEMPLIQNVVCDVYARRIKITAQLPDKDMIEHLWLLPPGCALKRMTVDLVREMWVPDGHRFGIWNDLVGGCSAKPDDLLWAMDELNRSEHTVRISQKTKTRLLSCEWHVHEKNDECEGSEEYKLLGEHVLWGQPDR
ncbi:uncharacterized protein RCC_09720 [Ramularia collo-cygni]|uniref:BTB domain-containing protein n=1 Tax=Ramularia collo-cygni TaxID=112498 RepID=A0A2D3V7N0_9PEZI|nr:uncharacterized protein RCC_09720 [Ramularia collo-cygni]CZT24003.1 uncharacterized protein RCC_09720 [Ramularia collo-cygni]